jgi:hypothetical protein
VSVGACSPMYDLLNLHIIRLGVVLPFDPTGPAKRSELAVLEHNTWMHTSAACHMVSRPQQWGTPCCLPCSYVHLKFPCWKASHTPGVHLQVWQHCDGPGPVLRQQQPPPAGRPAPAPRHSRCRKFKCAADAEGGGGIVRLTTLDDLVVRRHLQVLLPCCCSRAWGAPG